MDDEHLKKAEEHPSLGPHYFAASEIAQTFMAKFETDHFTPMARRFADEFYSKVNETIVDYLLSDTESNLQGAIWRGIDWSIEALMSGKQWALDRYALNIRNHDGEAIRAAIAKHIPAEIQNARIVDLENEITRLKERLEWARR